jgi:lipopolysaccharide transport system permease protein
MSSVQFIFMSYVVHIKPKSSWQLVDYAELWRFRELFLTFAWRDIKLRYKQTALGVIWVLFQPLVSTVIFTVFFGNFANIPSQGLPYSLFVLLGLVFWQFFANSLSSSANSFIENEHLVKKVYFPREILPLSKIVTTGIDFLISAVMLAGFLIYTGVAPTPIFLLILPLVLIITILSSAGLGLLLSSINIKYRDVRYILPFFMQLLIFITPVIYPLTIVRPSFQYLLALNPMTGVIDTLRSTLATGNIAHPDMLAISLISSVVLFIAGLFYFRSTERFFADIL